MNDDRPANGAADYFACRKCGFEQPLAIGLAEVLAGFRGGFDLTCSACRHPDVYVLEDIKSLDASDGPSDG